MCCCVYKYIDIYMWICNNRTLSTVSNSSEIIFWLNCTVLLDESHHSLFQYHAIYKDGNNSVQPQWSLGSWSGICYKTVGYAILVAFSRCCCWVKVSRVSKAPTPMFQLFLFRNCLPITSSSLHTPWNASPSPWENKPNKTDKWQCSPKHTKHRS